MFKRLGKLITLVLLHVCRMRFKTPMSIAKYTDFMIQRFFLPNSPSSGMQSQVRINSWTQASAKNSQVPINASLEVILVSTKKDFTILMHSIDYAFNACRNFVDIKVSIIVPADELEHCKNLFIGDSRRIKVHNENEFLSLELFDRLKKYIPQRYGWCLQQFLKVSACLSSNADYCLVLDSDTILLHSRQWVDFAGATILTPSEEFNEPYYEFLAQLDPRFDIKPMTFVSHHMLINPQHLKNLLIQIIGENPLELLIEKIEKYSNRDLDSPFCIDYEFFGQFMTSLNREQVFFEKWSNLGLSRKTYARFLPRKFLFKIIAIFFSSVSFHSWS